MRAGDAGGESGGPVASQDRSAASVEAFRRQKRLILGVWIALLPAAFLLMWILALWPGYPSALPCWFVCWCGIAAFWKFRIARCPVCRGPFPGVGMMPVFFGKAPFVHDCGARLQ